MLFGDGAGAVVLEAQPQHGTREDRGIIATRIRSDGRFEDLLYVDGGPGSTKTVGHLRMNGREVFRHAVQKISGVIEETLVMTGYRGRRDRSLRSASGQCSASSTASPTSSASTRKRS